MSERVLPGIGKRLLQLLALYLPGATNVRPQLHRLRGVDVGNEVFVGTAVIIETSQPQLVSIGNRVDLGIRTTIVAHARGSIRKPGGRPSVRIEDDVFIGPGVIILPNVTVGQGAVVMAGSVVTRSVPPLTMVQGNPAAAVARCGIPLGAKTPLKEFYRALSPLPGDNGGGG